MAASPLETSTEIMMKSTPKITDFQNIAIIHTAFIGDVVLVLYLAQLIKNINPNSKLTLITTAVAKPIGEICTAIDETYVYDKRNAHKGIAGIFSLAKKLKAKKIDLIISPHKSLRTTLLSYFSKGKYSVSFDKSALSFLYSKTIEYSRNHNEIFRNISLLNAFAIDENLLQKQNIYLKFDTDTITKVEKIIDNNHLKKDEYIVISPGSVWNTKRWQKENFAELIKLIEDCGVKCILTGSKDDKEVCEYIGNHTNAIDLSGKTSIPETILLIKFAKLIITNDSAPIHFAGIVNTQTVAIFGPTVTEFGFAPSGQNDIVIENTDIKCRPCGMHGHKKCPINSHICMSSITANYVYQQIKSIICK